MNSTNISWLLDSLGRQKEGKTFASHSGPSISVNELAGTAGAFYEKVRYLVDYKEEHTIRRSAIERIVKRKLVVERGGIGLSLLQELVSGGYLANKMVPEGAAKDIQLIIDKYRVLCAGSLGNSVLAGVIASEIERYFYPQHINDLVAETFYRTVMPRIKYTGRVSAETLRAQIYIACRRSLLEEDYEALRYAILIQQVPELLTVDPLTVVELKPRFIHALRVADRQLENQLGWKLNAKLKNHSVCFSVIKEIVRKYGVTAGDVFNDAGRLEQEIGEFLSEKYHRQEVQLGRTGLRAVLYIFITKTIVALAFELPYEKIFLDSIDYTALGTNVVFHPLLLWAMVKTAPRLSDYNTRLVIAGVENILHDDTKTIYVKSRSDNTFLLLMFGIFYTVLFTISFGAIVWALWASHFNVVSIILFMFFLTLVSYFGFRIRYNAKKWMISTDDESLPIIFWNFLTTPIVRTGRWLTRKFSSINIFVFIMDFIVEVPFKFILGTFDSFISYLKDKGDDAY